MPEWAASCNLLPSNTSVLKIKILYFAGLISLAIGAVYFATEMVANVFFIFTLIAYFLSKDEPFWLAFFLALHDGFFGFFGAFETTLAALPGLPAIEVTQLYILLSVIKARMAKPGYRPFYQTHLAILGIYLAFLVLQGYIVGLAPAMNIRFRVLKDIVPLLTFYSIPRLFDTKKSYRELFVYLFFIALFAFAAQAMNIFFFQSPPVYFGISNALNEFDMEITPDNPYRGFYNVDVVLITLFGAFFFLARKTNGFPSVLCYLIIATNLLIAFLSASRGWILFFSLVTVSFFLFIEKLSPKKILAFAAVSSVLLGLALFQPAIQTQAEGTMKRLQTLKALKQGDITAGGTLLRLSIRGPRVMKQWKASPLAGWGFSDHFYQYRDGHVGNQNILMHSGLAGLLLLYSFFGYFLFKLGDLSFRLPPGHPDKKAALVFLIFFAGWFFLHSTSGQQFGYFALPTKGLTQSLFFSLGAYLYYSARGGRTENSTCTANQTNEKEELPERPVLEN